MTTLIPSSCFVIGVIVGVVLVRYGFGLGVRSVQRIAEGLPLRDNAAEIDYSHTGAEDELDT